MINHYNIIRWY